MVAQFAALAGPKGQILSVALSFVSGFLSLFGVGGPKKKSIGQIVREEIITTHLISFMRKISRTRLKGWREHSKFLRHMWIGLPSQANRLPCMKQGHLKGMCHCMLAFPSWENWQVRYTAFSRPTNQAMPKRH